jgi:hypothetical protein
VKAQFTIQSGSRAGQIDVLSQPFILVGRHPQCELRFDADQDLDVSARHASITLAGKLYVLRDLGSTNGTLVNGQRLTGDHVLASKDIIQFGTSGPRVEFASIPDPPPSALPASHTPPPMETSAFQGASPPHRQILIPQGSPGSFKLPRGTPGRAGATTRIKIAVQEQTKKHRTVQYVLFAMLLLVTGAYFWSNSLNERRLVAQRELLLGQVDSLVAQIGTMSGTTQALQGALDSAKAEAERLKQRINASGATGPEIEQLKAQLKALPSNSETSPRWRRSMGLPLQPQIGMPWRSCSCSSPMGGASPAPRSRFNPMPTEDSWSPIVTSWSIRWDASRRKSASCSTARIRISGPTSSRWTTRPTWHCSRRRCTGGFRW